MSASAGDDVVQVEDVTLGYGDVIVQEHLSFAVHAREVFAILGPSGSGKSTLLRTMTGLYRPRHGRILLDGNDIYAAEGEQRSRLLRQFGVTFQSGALFGSMTLLENVRLPSMSSPTSILGEGAVALAKLNQVGLGREGGKMPAELSGACRSAPRSRAPWRSIPAYSSWTSLRRAWIPSRRQA